MNHPSHREIQPSLFDRLLISNRDDDHHSISGTQYHDRTSLRESVRRHLENLFNTRIRAFSMGVDRIESKQSPLNYGLPDLSTINLIDPKKRKQFCRTLEETIRLFEPRFRTVTVSTSDFIPKKGVMENTHRLRFRIEGVLHAEPYPESITLDSQLEPVSRTVHIKETTR